MNGIAAQILGIPTKTPPQRCRPGLRRGVAPERMLENSLPLTQLQGFISRLATVLSSSGEQKFADLYQSDLVARVDELQVMSSEKTAVALGRVRQRVARNGHCRDTLLESLAHACVVAERTIGLKPREGQCRAAAALLYGRFVEMPTGEGKTLASALAAAVTALDGTPVHVLTANDYLAQRDATRLAPLYTALGLSSGFVLPEMDESMRCNGYACDITHLTGKQAGFDWMRDALALGSDTTPLVNRLGSLTNPNASGSVRLLQRGLCAGILDEADSMLLDEARTPLVLAIPLIGNETAENEASIALALAQMLSQESDFQLRLDTREAIFTDVGIVTLARMSEKITGAWRATRFRNERVRQALVALHLWRRDHDYIVRNGKVLLVDEQSGRALPDRRLQNGLHGLLELKEHCGVTPENETVASIAFQSFFLRYVRLVGLSGTLNEAKGELARVYGSSLVQVEAANPSQLTTLPALVFASRAEQLDALIEEVRVALASNRPVLVGTRSVEQSQGVSALLSAHRIQHRVLDASQDVDESTIVAEAGRVGRVTVATNMAGRGTDIPLEGGVAEQGGLHLVSLAFNDAGRIDRQLIGRAARQGDPGSFRQLWALDDPLLERVVPILFLNYIRRLLERRDRLGLANTLALLTVRFAQRRLEWQHAVQRRNSLAARTRIVRHATLSGHVDHPT